MPHKTSKEALSLASAIVKDAESLGFAPKVTTDWISLFDTLVVEEPIRSKTRKLFLDGHYAQAVETAFKCLNNEIRRMIGKRRGLDTVTLMQTAFSPKNPRLKINTMQNMHPDSEENQQHGYMEIYAGSIRGIRHPRAHEDDFIDTPQRAIELLTLANHLLRTAREAIPTVKT
jgi:uncharacterized protein (TIGR02391 family)